VEKRRKVLVAGAAIAGVLAVGGGIAIAQSTGGEEPLTGATLDRATEAALEAVGGGTVVDSEAGDGDGTYEVEVRREDGTLVDVVLDAEFHVVTTDADGEKDVGERNEQEGSEADTD
jgi:hypothetical protein